MEPEQIGIENTTAGCTTVSTDGGTSIEVEMGAEYHSGRNLSQHTNNTEQVRYLKTKIPRWTLWGSVWA